MPDSNITYIERILEKTTNKNTPLHQKAFGIITCDNLLNPNLLDLTGQNKIIKPLLNIYMVNFEINSIFLFIFVHFFLNLILYIILGTINK